MHVTPEAIRISLRVPPDFLAALDDHRRQLPDLPNRTVAIKRILEQALANSPNRKPRKTARGATR
jgi:hypothetical protein